MGERFVEMWGFMHLTLAEAWSGARRGRGRRQESRPSAPADPAVQPDGPDGEMVPLGGLAWGLGTADSGAHVRGSRVCVCVPSFSSGKESRGYDSSAQGAAFPDIQALPSALVFLNSLTVS